MKKLLVVLFFISAFCLPIKSFGQVKGIVRGSVIDDATGETMIGVTVRAKGDPGGSITDFDGKFELRLAVGTYDLQLSFVSFETITITGIEVKEGSPTVLNDIRMKEAVSELQEVVVTAEIIRDSEEALLTVKRRSSNLLDGISAASFEKIGDGDAAAAVKRVTGVSVEGGKYVYVRGLGDRYTKTTLNDVDIPGLDPDRNSIQMDIFPTSLINNLVVSKSALARMPADFTGGIVNIETKDFPDEPIFDVSIGIGYNPQMHFKSGFIMGNSGSTDFLGFDDGTRALPAGANRQTIPSPISGDTPENVNRFLKNFNPILGAATQTSFLNYDLGITKADQLDLGGNTKFGYIFALTYKSGTSFYDNVAYGEYQRLLEPTQFELRYATTQNGIIGERNVLGGLLGGLALKTVDTKLRFTAMHLQNGVNTAGQFSIDNDGEAVGQSGYTAFSNNLEYNQRGLTNLLLNGEHHLASDQWEIDWRVSPTWSNIQDPDIRKTAFTYSNTDTTFSAGAGGNPTRIWRNLSEFNLVGKVDVLRKYNFNGEDGALRFGVSYTWKERDYNILSYDLQFFGTQPDFGIDPNAVLTDENLFPNGNLYYSSGNNTPNPNEYNSTIDNKAIYVSNEFYPFANFKLTTGLRGEYYVQRHTGRDVEYASFGTGNNLVNDIVLQSFDLFPSVNTVYSLSDQQNIRASYSRTIARPSFKEMSFAQILDPISNRIFNGGLFQYGDWDGKLTETRIDNIDLRWEMYFERGELLSVSGFYKAFDNPIELVRIQEQQASTEYQPRNVGDGQLFGAEVEFRKSLSFISYQLEGLSLNGNVSLVESRIQMTDREFNSRKQYEKQGETIKSTRTMAGQAPYILNVGLSYASEDQSMDAGLFYNVKGQTLYIVGAGLFPDVYTMPFHSLNLSFNKSFGPTNGTKISFNASNLLNDLREEQYVGFEAKNQTFTQFNPGVSFSIGLSHSF